MAVRFLRVVTHDTFAYWHDEEGHGGEMSFADVQFARIQRGGRHEEDRRFVTLRCHCGAVSLHPVSGGCDPEGVQRLFVEKLRRVPELRAKPVQEIVREMRAAIIALDGPERIRIADDGSSLGVSRSLPDWRKNWGPVAVLDVGDERVPGEERAVREEERRTPDDSEPVKE